MTALLEALDCHTYYADAHVLHGVSITVSTAEVAIVIGRNGMGKTTLVRTIMGLNPPRQGTVRFLGDDITGLTPERVARRGLGLVPQGRGIFPSLRVRENLTVAARPEPGGWTQTRVLQRFPRLAERAGAWGDQLSGGEQQMLAIGRALLMNPKCIVLDEPFEGLAPALVDEVVDVIGTLRDDGIGVLLIEQQVESALSIADRVYVMGKGVIVFDGTKEAFANRTDIQSTYLGVSG